MSCREEEIIERLKSKERSKQGLDLGIGDDAAVISTGIGSGKKLVVCADTLVEGVHFKREWSTPRQIAQKALRINLSDSFAMGASPCFVLLSLALPKDIDEEFLGSFCSSFLEECRAYGVELIGGDTSGSDGGLFLSVTVLAFAPEAFIKRRSSAQPNDSVYVTGPLGDSFAGLMELSKEIAPSKNEATRSPAAQSLIERHLCGYAEALVGPWLGERQEVSSMMDLSDGLRVDLPRMCAASGVGAQIDVDLLPTSDDLGLWCRENGKPLYELAATGGEDYCLLYTVKSADVLTFEKGYQERFGSVPIRIGHIRAGNEVTFLRSALPVDFSLESHRHFG